MMYSHQVHRGLIQLELTKFLLLVHQGDLPWPAPGFRRRRERPEPFGEAIVGSVRGFKGRLHTSGHLLQNAQNPHSGHSTALRFAHSLHSAIVRD